MGFRLYFGREEGASPVRTMQNYAATEEAL